MVRTIINRILLATILVFQAVVPSASDGGAVGAFADPLIESRVSATGGFVDDEDEEEEEEEGDDDASGQSESYGVLSHLDVESMEDSINLVRLLVVKPISRTHKGCTSWVLLKLHTKKVEVVLLGLLKVAKKVWVLDEAQWSTWGGGGRRAQTGSCSTRAWNSLQRYPPCPHA
jgi:hypothetical protein